MLKTKRYLPYILRTAARNGRDKICLIVIGLGHIGNAGEALRLACRFGHLSTARLLVKKQCVEITKRKIYLPALIDAATSGHTDIVAWLTSWNMSDHDRLRWLFVTVSSQGRSLSF